MMKNLFGLILEVHPRHRKYQVSSPNRGSKWRSIILDVPEEHVPKPQAVVPPMHSETSPVSNDENRGLVPGSKLFHISIRDPLPTKFETSFGPGPIPYQIFIFFVRDRPVLIHGALISINLYDIPVRMIYFSCVPTSCHVPRPACKFAWRSLALTISVDGDLVITAATTGSKQDLK